MKAVVLHGYGPPESMVYEEYPHPGSPPARHVLVRVAAAGVNPADAGLASGAHPDVWPTFPRVNGRDVAGIVEATGPGVTGYSIGDEVYGFSEMDEPGTWADLVMIQARTIAHAPKRATLTEAGALPVVALTAWVTLFHDFGIKAGETLLINGAAGGVGSMAVQMAKNAGAHVIGSASTAKLDYLRDLGCDECVDYTRTPIDSACQQVDAVIDVVGGDSLDRCYDLVRRGGWLACASAPADTNKADRLGIKAGMMRGRVEGDALKRIAAEFDAQRLRVLVTATYLMSDAVRALAQVSRRHGLGKIALVNE